MRAVTLLKLARAVQDQVWFGRTKFIKIISAELDTLPRLVEVTLRLETSDRACACVREPGDIITDRHALRHPELLSIPSYHW